MGYLQHTDNVCLLVLSMCLLSIKVTSTQEGFSYFFYRQTDFPRDCKEASDQCSSGNISGVYAIKPDGYPEPFEVYCDNELSSGGWTIIQSRIDGSLTFNRSWEDYKSGFGFISNEFWIGLDKLSYLTNQAVYELRIAMVLSNGSFFYVTYNSFRISDEWSDYALVSAGEYRSTWGCIVSICPLNMTHDSCTCQNMCADPIRQTDCYAHCLETCVPEGCLVSETNSFISNGESFINSDCSTNCTCIDNQLNCNVDYECSTDATCTVTDGIRKCYCNEGYEGDGETCTALYTDCYDAYRDNRTTNGVYTILPTGWTKSPFTVFCDMTTAGGGWTVFQRRTDGVTNFYRTWNEYQHGFGIQDAGHDFWLGNEQIHYLTNQREYKLRVDIVTSDGSPKYAEYTSFQIGDNSTKYRLNFGSYSGDASNGLGYNQGKQFSTHDQDNDGCSGRDHAEGHQSGWWFTANYCSVCGGSSCHKYDTETTCKGWGTDANLNGDYNGGNGKNIFWGPSSIYCNINSAEMKVRRSSV